MISSKTPSTVQHYSNKTMVSFNIFPLHIRKIPFDNKINWRYATSSYNSIASKNDSNNINSKVQLTDKLFCTRQSSGFPIRITKRNLFFPKNLLISMTSHLNKLIFKKSNQQRKARSLKTCMKEFYDWKPNRSFPNKIIKIKESDDSFKKNKKIKIKNLIIKAKRYRENIEKKPLSITLPIIKLK